MSGCILGVSGFLGCVGGWGVCLWCEWGFRSLGVRWGCECEALYVGFTSRSILSWWCLEQRCTNMMASAVSGASAFQPFSLSISVVRFFPPVIRDCEGVQVDQSAAADRDAPAEQPARAVGFAELPAARRLQQRRCE